MTAAVTDKEIILFDGVCNLCNDAVRFIVKRDRTDRFRFAPLQGQKGRQFLEERGLATEDIDSVVLIVPGEAYYLKSSAVLKIAQSFGGIWKLSAIFEWVPRPIRDWIYDRIANNRYRWFGKKEACMVPTPELQKKFL